MDSRSSLRYLQDPRLQGRAPGFRQGQDRDKTGTSWGQDMDKTGKRQGQVRQGKDRDKIREGGVMGDKIGTRQGEVREW